MTKEDFIKLIDGDNSYVEEFKNDIRIKVIELNEGAREEIKINDFRIIDDVVDDIVFYLLQHMIKHREKWENEEDKYYTVRYKWCIVNWLYGYWVKIEKQNERRIRK